ncbi:MAG: hypothetical protein K0Q89_46 [Thermomicrobiales bacterium]|jgi:hypothetical protein|nr:hypothetical protein [Thermomicrobiales bacterium]
MRLKVEIDTDNAAFVDVIEERDELKRIMDRVADRAACGEAGGKCLDSNGNTVGKWTYR